MGKTIILIATSMALLPVDPGVQAKPKQIGADSGACTCSCVSDDRKWNNPISFENVSSANCEILSQGNQCSINTPEGKKDGIIWNCLWKNADTSGGVAPPPRLTPRVAPGGGVAQ